MADQTTQPVTQSPTTAETPASAEQPAAAPVEPTTGPEADLQIRDLHEQAKKAIEDEIGAASVQWLLSYEKDLADPDKQAAAETALGQRLDEMQARYQTDPLIANLPEAMSDLRRLINNGLLKDFPTEPQTGYRDARKEVLTSLMNVMLRGHIKGGALDLLLKGGIRYRQEPRTNTDHNVDWVGYYDPTSKTVEVYPRLFKITDQENGQPGEIEARTETTMLHELAHAYDQADGLLFNNAALRAIAQSPESQVRPDKITDIEWRTFQRMLLNPKQAQPWLPRYISAKLEGYATGQRTPEASYELIAETKTEWFRIFLETDGSFGNFMLKLLENCSFVQHHLEQRQQPGYVPKPLANSEVVRALADFTNNLKVTQHPEAIGQQIGDFMATHLNQPELQPFHEQITDLFLLGASLYLRFSALRGTTRLEDGQIVDRRDVITKNLQDGRYADSGGSGWHDTADVGASARRAKEQTIWHVILEAIFDFPGFS